jgi:hypothetical protein
MLWAATRLMAVIAKARRKRDFIVEVGEREGDEMGRGKVIKGE